MNSSAVITVSRRIVELVANCADIALLPESLPVNLLTKKLVPLSDELPPERLDFVIARDQDQALIQNIVELAMETSAFLRRAAT